MLAQRVKVVPTRKTSYTNLYATVSETPFSDTHHHNASDRHIFFLTGYFKFDLSVSGYGDSGPFCCISYYKYTEDVPDIQVKHLSIIRRKHKLPYSSVIENMFFINNAT